MSSPRPVRIARARTTVPLVAPEPTAPTDVQHRVNVSGTIRGRRLFLLFAVVLLAFYVLFLGLAARAAGGLGASPDPIALLTVALVALGAVGWTITLARAPRGAWLRADAVVVEERWGRTRRFPRSPGREFDVVERYGAGWLSPDPTELVRLSSGRGRARHYLVDREFFAAERAA